MSHAPTFDDLFHSHLMRAARGVEESVSWLIAKFSAQLSLQAKYRVRGPLARTLDPEDLVQDVWLIMLSQKLPNIAAEAPAWTYARFLAYMSGTVRMLAIQHRKRLYHQTDKQQALFPEFTGKTQALNDATAPLETASEQARRREALQDLHTAIHSLPRKHREIIILRGIESRRNVDVARDLGESPEAVATRYKRARRELGKLLDGDVPPLLPED